MGNRYYVFDARYTITILLASLSTAAIAQQTSTAGPAGSSRTSAAVGDVAVGEIVVTAQKRAQSINSVGLTITAATRDELAMKGVTSIADLNKVSPGFTFTQSPYSTPVYTLRGIGLYDYSFGSAPSVAVYVDEVPLPFPLMQQGATLDVERVEVLKGPQGTLFGQSATGGAINYIAAKPTDHLTLGSDLTYARFGRVEADGFISGPVTDTLKARASFRVVEGGAWQYSVTRPQDRNGNADQVFGRVLLDWKPSDRVSFNLNVNGWRDNSQTEAPQFVSNQLNTVAAPDARDPYAVVNPAAYAALTNPSSGSYDPSFISRQNTVFNRAAAGEQQSLEYLGGPGRNGALPNDARQAEWDPDFRPSAHDTFYQVSLRGDAELTDNTKLTSITSYEKAKINRVIEGDGTDVQGSDYQLEGFVSSFNQELRLTLQTKRLNAIAGGNFSHSDSSDELFYHFPYISVNEPLPGLRFTGSDATSHSKVNEYAAFANIDYKVTSNLSILGGIRYTENRRQTSTCLSDYTADQNLSKTFGNSLFIPGFGYYDLQTVLGLNPANHVVVAPGQCVVLNNTVAPTDPEYLRPTLTPFVQHLNEHNVSFRIGANYKFDQGTLLYATVSQGYKAGIISGQPASATSQFAPAKQEKVIAYEMGAKAPLFNRKLQLNGAAFYYDYSGKQVRSRVRDAVFGLLEELVNVPKSRIWGLEGEIVARPLRGLNVAASGTYLNSKVTRSFSATSAAIYNQQGYTGDFTGSPLPFTPKFAAVFDAQYERPVSDRLKGFVGGTLTYEGRDNSTFYTETLPAPDFYRPSHALLDLRAGVAAPDGSWRAYVFGKNVANKFYVQSYWSPSDTLARYVGQPATYGATISFNLQ